MTPLLMLPDIYCPKCHQDEEFLFETFTGLCYCECGEVVLLSDEGRVVLMEASEKECVKSSICCE
ncbi:hypothetical protein NF212_06400 [Parasalinivibrio latis]|uniref:hypothetical protein n=1 Tax=Parasalinivibrio latis TaxID=2952610 RepID=UPI0030E07ED9